MKLWHLEPHGPVMIRDGRPFGLDTEGARSLDFPTPSVVAGSLRSHLGFGVGAGTFGMTPEEARAVAVRGPLLCEWSGPEPSPLLPTPRDLVCFPGKDRTLHYRLEPQARWKDACSLPSGLLPVGPAQPLPSGKPSPTPAFLSLAVWRSWATDPRDGAWREGDTRPGLLHELRTHVSIDPSTGTASEGKLFQTDGLRMTGPGGHRLSFLVGCADARLRPGLLPFGGERRIARLEPVAHDPFAGWTPPAVAARRARVLLLTPASFAEGAVPVAIAGARVVAAAVGRPLVVSGWDLALQRPKPVRRFAGAGSVYWVELPPALDPSDWVSRVHLREVSAEEQDRRDGFGLAAVGVW